MPIFQLVLQTSADSLPETLQFIAADVLSALRFANQHTNLAFPQNCGKARFVCVS